MVTFVALAAATLVSEDLTSVLAGILIAQGSISPATGVAACALGIYAGDLLLFAAGRLAGGRTLGWPRVSRALTASRVNALRGACHRHLGPIVLGSRFIPGTRLALYVAAGALNCPARSFAWWSAIAVALWTPAVVLASANVLPSSGLLQSWFGRIVAAVLFVGAARTVQRIAATPYVNARIAAAISRAWRWEFWPMWLFYAPVAAWLAALVVRYRGVGVIAAANPGIPDGGIVGESKHRILTKLPAEWTIPSMLVEPGPLDARLAHVTGAMTRRQWHFPLIFKPDVGQRGAGVKLVRSIDEAARYLERERAAVVVQPYHPGPYEAGVFYSRMPDWPRGRILSITDKQFPAIVGDGQATIRDLIWADQRLRMQARTFLSRHARVVDRVPAPGERVPLAIAGNHCQGTLFRDGHHLITAAFERRIDDIARSYRGFFVGRFDIRYSDVQRFTAGEDLAIVELNGATAESTNIYDPSRTLMSAYRQLFQQWSLIFAIGAANRAHGAATLSVARLLQLLRAHFSAAAPFETSD
jgi:membrane protein DedA with SNARE-associated domain